MSPDLVIILLLAVAILSFEFGCRTGAAAERDETLLHISRVVGLITLHQPRPARHYLVDVAMTVLQRKHADNKAAVKELTEREII